MIERFDNDLKTRSLFGNSLLHTASIRGFERIVALLLKKQPDIIYERNNSGNSPLHLAIFYKHYEIITLLLYRGAKLSICDSLNNNPLHTSINLKDKTSFNLLFSYLLDKIGPSYKFYDIINARDKLGNTPIKRASENNDKEIVKKLIKYKANVNITDQYGWSPLHNAIKNGYNEIIDLLIKVKEADRNKKFRWFHSIILGFLSWQYTMC